MADAGGYRTWKDGINDQPRIVPRIVCGICGCPREQFDHAICHEVAAGRGIFTGPFVVLEGGADA